MSLVLFVWLSFVLNQASSWNVLFGLQQVEERDFLFLLVCKKGWLVLWEMIREFLLIQ